MTRILVQRGSGGSSSNPNRPSVPGTSSVATPPQQAVNPSTPKDEEHPELELSDLKGSHEQHSGSSSEHEDKSVHKSNDLSAESGRNSSELVCKDNILRGDGVDEGAGAMLGELGSLQASERFKLDEIEALSDTGSRNPNAASYPPPPPPLPPLRPVTSDMGIKRTGSGSLSSVRTGSSAKSAAVSNVVCHSPAVSRPSSPKSCSEAEGYNSADEQVPCFRPSSYNDMEKERQFEADIRRIKGLEVRRMLEDGNCLFRAVADQVYGDSEAYNLVRQMCIDYMERERDYFSHFITEGFTSYCKRKRRDKVYGNNMEIQALSEMYNRPIHIYSYSTEPINIFQGSYDTDVPPIRLSYHQGNHYNSLVDPRRSSIGAGLGFSSLQGKNIDKHQIKAAIKAQQDHQIENALLAEGRFYSDLELTEKEIERMVMETSRAEYLADSKLKQVGFGSSSTSGAEPSSSGARKLEDGSKSDEGKTTNEAALSSNMQMLLSMGFGYLQVMEAHSIFGDDVDSILCYLLEMGDGSPMRVGSLNQRYKGKATE